MVYIDTNVLIYASIEQDMEKKERSLSLLEELISKNRLALSTLAIQEFVFTLAKLRIDSQIIRDDSSYFMNFVDVEQDFWILKQAIEYCCDKDQCRNINDIMHILLAQKAKCSKIVTFDSDFKKFVGFDGIEIEVLQ